jgi:hypothetical protein
LLIEARSHFIPLERTGVEFGLLGSLALSSFRIVVGDIVSSQYWASPRVLSADASCEFKNSVGSGPTAATAEFITAPAALLTSLITSLLIILFPIRQKLMRDDYCLNLREFACRFREEDYTGNR